MKLDDRQKLFDRLMLGASLQCLGDATTLKIFEESTTEDLDAIEPIIDEIVERERKQYAEEVLGVVREVLEAKIKRPVYVLGPPRGAHR